MNAKMRAISSRFWFRITTIMLNGRIKFEKNPVLLFFSDILSRYTYIQS